MRTFLVSMIEAKYYLVETENDHISPEEMADEFLAHDGNHVMNIKLAGKAIPEMDVIELGNPTDHFFNDGFPTDDDESGPWPN
jgi:hypothetical protein